MLTLGAEYEDTWAPSSDKKRPPRKRARGEGGSKEETSDPCDGEPDEASWRATDPDAVQRYDTVLHLDGLSKTERKDGVRQLVKKHETLNNILWPGR